MRFFVHSDPEGIIGTATLALRDSLNRRVSTYRPRVSPVPGAPYVVVELDGELIPPALRFPGADEDVVAAVEEAVASSVGLLIWLEVSNDRNTLLFLRANADDPDVSGEAYIRPYSHPSFDTEDATAGKEPKGSQQ